MSRSYAGDVSLTVRLPDELARRVEAVAAARNQSPEEVAVEAIEAQLPAGRRLSFSGVGSPGPGAGDTARQHREVLAERVVGIRARDV